MLKNFLKTNTSLINRFSAQKISETESKSDENLLADDDIRTPEVEEAIEKQEKLDARIEKMRDVSHLAKKTPRFRHFSLPYSMKTHRDIDTNTAWSKVFSKIEEEKEYDLTLEQKIKMFSEKKQQEIDDYKKK